MESSQTINTYLNDSLLAKFFTFLRRPSYYSNSPNRSFAGILFDLSRLYSFLYLLAITSGLLIYLVSSLGKYDLDQNAVVDLVTNAPILQVVLLAAILAPLTEELCFRLFLRFSHIKLALSAIFISLFVSELFDTSSINGLALLGIYILVGVLTYVLSKLFISKSRGENLFKKHIGKLFYLSVTTFALIHSGNYLNINSILIVLPILVLPQFFAGLFFGYIRMNYGFLWSVLMHSAYNFLTLIPFILFSFGSERLQGVLKGTEYTMEALPKSDLYLLGFLALGALFVFFIFLLLNIQLIVEYFIKRNKLTKIGL